MTATACPPSTGTNPGKATAATIQADQEPRRFRELRKTLQAEQEGAICPLCRMRVSETAIRDHSFRHDRMGNIIHQDCHQVASIVNPAILPEPRPRSHTVLDSQVPDFQMQPGEEEVLFEIVTPQGARVCASGQALEKIAQARRKVQHHPIWTVTTLGPYGPEAMDALVREVNAWLEADGFAPLVPTDHRGWDQERVLAFLSLAREEFEWEGSRTINARWPNGTGYWQEILRDYAPVFGEN